MGARLYFMLAFRNNSRSPNPVLVGVFDILKARGFQVEIGIAEQMLLRPEELSVSHDLYILKSHTDLWLSLAGVLHLQGAKLLNPYLSCIATQNKIMTARRLHAAGIPIPRSWVTGNLSLLNVVAAGMPLVMKPFDGNRGNGVHIVNEPGELAAFPSPPRPVLVQEFVPGCREELKVAVIGTEVFATRQHGGTNGKPPQRIPCTVSAEVRRIALRCGEVCGLGLYGLDMIDGFDGPVVVDLNYFPSYKGVRDAAPVIADYIEAYACADVPAARRLGDVPAAKAREGVPAAKSPVEVGVTSRQ
jgi:ribosomal protein S6--L-glutamate ligase